MIPAPYLAPTRLGRLRDSLIRKYWVRKLAKREKVYRDAFERFYAGLPSHDNLFYMVFPNGLMHWVDRTAGCIPDHVNLVLVAMNLSDEEQAWLRQRFDRPFFHIPTKVDDQTVWHMLFETNLKPFGWVDVDLFVLNASLFEEMATLNPKTSVNGAWSFRCPGGFDVLSTHCLFVNTDAVKDLRQKGHRVSPCVHTYEGTPLGRFYAHAYSHIPSKRDIEVIRPLLPADDQGRPMYPSATYEKFWFQGFDTMVLYQLVARGHGYRLNKVRELSGISATPEHYSDELVHVAALSYYRGFVHHQDHRLQHYYALLLQFDYLVLARALERNLGLPASYTALLDELGTELERLKIQPEQCSRNVRNYFMNKGIDSSTFDHPAWADVWEPAGVT